MPAENTVERPLKSCIRTGTRSHQSLRRPSFDSESDAQRRTIRRPAGKCIGLCCKRETPTDCVRCLQGARAAWARRGVPRAHPGQSPRLFAAIAHARMRAVSLALELNLMAPDDSTPAQAVWSPTLVSIFDAVHAPIGTGTRRGSWRSCKPTSALPPAQFIELVESSRDRWEVLHAADAELPKIAPRAKSCGAHWQGPRIIMDTGCGDSIVSHEYARAAGLKSDARAQHCHKDLRWSRGRDCVQHEGDAPARRAS